MKKNTCLFLSLVLIGLFFFTSGCTQKKLESLLYEDIYRRVPQEVHDKIYPHRHEDHPEKHCIFNENERVYYCQFDNEYFHINE